MLSNVIGLAQIAVGALGAFLVVIGAVKLGMGWHQNGNLTGGETAGAIASMIGGGVIVAAAAFIGSIDVSALG